MHPFCNITSFSCIANDLSATETKPVTAHARVALGPIWALKQNYVTAAQVWQIYDIFQLLIEMVSVSPITVIRKLLQISPKACEIQEHSLLENTRWTDLSAEGVWWLHWPGRVWKIFCPPGFDPRTVQP